MIGRRKPEESSNVRENLKYPSMLLKEAADKLGWGRSYSTPQYAYADLIDKVSGEGTWESNPWVWVYEFELMK